MKTLVIYFFGAWSCYGFMQTKYRYADLPRYTYFLDVALAIALLIAAYVVQDTP